jgi:transposase
MYLRHTLRNKDGKAHTYWRLVRSVRNGKKVRQETIAQLGELKGVKLERAKALADRLGGRLDQRGLFDPPIEKEVVEVRLQGVRMERVRRFGDVWLGEKLWRMAKFDEFFESQLPQGREEIPWWTMAEILTVARLCEPSSELHIAEDWFRKTALGDILGIDSGKVNEDRLYRGLDKALPLKDKLEGHLRKRWEGLFGTTFDLLLYDVTSSYFEGKMEGNPEAQRGHSRDHRTDCKQVCLGLVVTTDGLPLGYEIFAGNVHDIKTVKHIVGSMEAKYGKTDRIWVMDRGMVSEEIMGWMRRGGRRYVVGCPKSELRKHREKLMDPEGWKTVGGGVKVRYAVVPSQENEDVYLLCQSEDRKQKELSMQRLFTRRIGQALGRLKRRLERSQKPVSLGSAERQVGRLLQRNQRAGRLFRIEFKKSNPTPSKLELVWGLDPERLKWAERSAGCYILRTAVRDWKEEDVWKLYIQLTQVENAFRVHKTDLKIRPIYHQKKLRTRAHIFICFLAYVLWKILEGWQSRAGLGNSPRTLLEEIGQIQSGDVILPTTTGEQIKLRCIVRPENEQKVLLQHLGLQIPRRMKIPEFMPGM